MKQKLFLTLALLMTFCSYSKADNVLIAEIDWTKQSAYYSGVWYNSEYATLKVSSNGLEYNNNPPENANYWDSQVPMIAHIPYLQAGDSYQVTFTVDAPAAGDLRLDICSWDGSGATSALVFGVEKGSHEYTIDFNDYPTSCTDAMIFYQCGKIPGNHIIKKVQVWGPEDNREAYAVLSDGGKTLTFYYDTSKNSYGANAYPLNTGNNSPRWTNWDNPTIEKVVFDKSFRFARPTTTFGWFQNQEKLTTIEGLNYLNTSEVTNMSEMFYNCKKLTYIPLSGFNTSKVESMASMFNSCESLTSIDGGYLFTGNVKYMDYMFYNCKALTDLDINGFDTKNVTSMDNMFGWCESLQRLDLSNFNTSKVTIMYEMFTHCSMLEELNLESFDTSNVTNMDDMFSYCPLLTTIYVGEKWNVGKVVDYYNMFYNCNSIKGEKGTTYDANHVGKDYAHIDGGSSNPGYLSNVSCLYDMSIANTKVTKENCYNILGNGIFSYSPSTKTLTVKGNYKYNNNTPFIDSKINGLIIDVPYDAELEGTYENKPLIELRNGSTTIKGNGKLTLKTKETAIYPINGASVTIENMDMDIDALWGIAGPRSSMYQEKLTIKSSNVTIVTSSYVNDPSAICDLKGGIILEGCSITYPSNATIKDDGVYIGNNMVKDLTITAGSGIATGVELQDKGQRSKVKGQSEEWYTIDGQKLSGVPAKKGIYIHNGKKVTR